jgi:hypothetical protein
MPPPDRAGADDENPHDPPFWHAAAILWPGARPAPIASTPASSPDRPDDLHAHRQALRENRTGTDSAGRPIRLAGTTTSIQR